MAEFKKGDRLRLTFEGVYEMGADILSLRADDGHIRYFSSQVGHWEVIEPKYEPGAYYRDAMGCIYRLSSTGKRWHYMTISGMVDTHVFDHPSRPLVKLVPEQ